MHKGNRSKAGKKARITVIGCEQRGALQAGARRARRGVAAARASIDELMADAARMFVEQLLVLSATEVAGERTPGKAKGARSAGASCWPSES